MSPVDDMIPVRTPRDLGALIREHRGRLGLDQRALAERVGVSRQWIIEVERGKAGAAVGLLLRTLEALGVTLLVDDAPSPARRASRSVAADTPDVDAIVRRARKRPG
jgi:HTH-type transcriptional regulator/antitoxin HipB